MKKHINKELLHFTESINVKKILNEGFVPSINSNENPQWLGNGIYYFPCSPRYLPQGKAIAKRFIEDKDSAEVSVVKSKVSCFFNNYLDLNGSIEFEMFSEMVDDVGSLMIEISGVEEFPKKWKHFKELLKKNKKFDNEHGSMLGELLDSFIYTLNNTEGMDYDIKIIEYDFRTSYLFLHGGSSSLQLNTQYCLKDSSLITENEEFDINNEH